MIAYPVSGYTLLSRKLTLVPEVVQDELWVAEQCREAINCLENALLAPPMQITRELDAAIRIVTRMHARIRIWAYEGTTGGDSDRWTHVLEQLNTVQHIAMGVASPYSSNRRKSVEQARQLLQSVLTDGLY